MRFHPWNILLFTGLLWLAIGFMLTMKGLNLLVGAMPITSQQTCMLLICLALLIGFIKGRFVLSKTVKRVSVHLLSQKGPLKISDAYPKSYVFILASMVLIAFVFKILPISKTVHGFIDLAIGSALVQGALHYFRYFNLVKAEGKNK